MRIGRLCGLCAFLAAVGSPLFAADLDEVTTTITWCNPLDVTMADPTVLREGDTWYLYGTTATYQGFRVYKSPDLVNWAAGPLCYEKSGDSWGQQHFWAPEVIKRGNGFYLFYAVQHEDGGDRNICVAHSKSPEGPFQNVKSQLIEGGSYIDFHPYYHAPTNEYFGYFVGEGRTKPGIYAAKLNDKFVDLATSPVLCLEESQPWETNWVEGPFIVPHNGLLYMMYSGSAYWRAGYSVGYAIADNPIGPWRKFEGNPVLHNTEQVSGPGHNCVVQTGDTYLAVYHRHYTPSEKKRVLAMDRIIFKPDPNGGPDLMTLPDAPSTTTQTLTLSLTR